MNRNDIHSPSTVLLTVLLVLCLLAIQAAAFGFESGKELPQYSIDFWHDIQGLKSSRIKDIIQTRDGYLWLATDGGLVRFDGADFTTFNVQTGSLKYNETYSLKEDNEGGLWISTFGGGLTHLKDGRFTTFTTADGLIDDAIEQMDIDPDGNLWIATLLGVCRYSHGTFTNFTQKDGLVYPWVNRICAGSKEGIFVIANRIPQRFVNGKFVVEKALIGKDGRISNFCTGIDGSLWLVFNNNAVKKLKDGILTACAPANELNGVIIGKIYEDPNGTVWLGTNKGLYRLKNGKVEILPLRYTGIDMGEVMSFCTDREGSLWLGLDASGIARIRKHQLKIFADGIEFSDHSINSVFQDSKGNIWIGATAGLVRYSNGHFTKYTETNGFPIRYVTSIGEDKNGNMWVGASGELIIMREGKFFTGPNWERTFTIKAIYRDPKGCMWVVPDGGGLLKYEYATVTAYNTNNGLPSNNVRGILYDRQGALWVTTLGGGVCRFADGKFTTYTTNEGLGSNRVGAVCEDESGLIWFLTKGGLSRFKDGRFFNYTNKDGLLMSEISGMLEDAKGYFWFSCSQGIFRVSKNELNDFADGKIKKVTSYAYGVKDGMQAAVFAAGYLPNAWKTRDGKLLFSSLKGVVEVDPNNISLNTLVPPVHIEKVLINKGSHNPVSYVEVTPGAGEVEIHYTALSYAAPEKVRFKYRLGGYDENWVDAGDRRSIYYASLSPGHYRFQVIACNNDGVWNETGASLSFYLKPHYYQTFWFYGIILFTFVGIGIGVYYLRVWQILKREKELTIRIEEATANIKRLHGLIPICAKCKKIRDDKGYWNQLEQYIHEHSEAKFSHGVCPTCAEELYGAYISKNKSQSGDASL